MFIRKFFKQFLKRFMPDLLKDMIIEKTEFLEKELLSITGKKKKGIVDVLVKVYLKNGLEEYILFHIEVQGYSDKEFQERMYGYYVRTWDKYRRLVVSLALIVNKPKNKVISNFYRMVSYGTNLNYEYNLIDISSMNYKELIASDNPVDIGVSILVNTKEIAKPLRKIYAIERLKQLGLDQVTINILMAFIDRVLN